MAGAIDDLIIRGFNYWQILPPYAQVREGGKLLEQLLDAVTELNNKLKAVRKLASFRHGTPLIKADPIGKPGGYSDWTDERWNKHWENSRRAELMTTIAPISAESWEKIAVLLMDRIDEIAEVCKEPTNG